jgi:uncharacterized phage protein gp47/JayE
MAAIPTPKSYSQILGTMITAFQAKYPIGGMKVGGALLTILEAAASADFRASMDTLNLIASTTLASASGTALDRIALDENTQRIGTVTSTGQVTVTDANIARQRSPLQVTPAQAPPTIGATSVYIVTAIAVGSVFPASGSFYIGRGTSQIEGPFPYTRTSGTGGDGTDPSWVGYKLVITAGTLAKKHYSNEYVTLAQGGDRAIPSGTQLTTPSGPTDSIQFSVVDSATLLDGEASVDGVLVSCSKPGLIGNVPINSLSFVSPPFTGATASNALPFSNGAEAEDDDALRDRIQTLRQTRSLGTPLALTTALIGVKAPDENKTIRSASYVETTDTFDIYLDDGNGYEQVDVGVVEEVLTEYAPGSQQYFQLSNRPITQCLFEGTQDGPFSLNVGDYIEATVYDYTGSYVTRHTFSTSDAADLSIAQAWEVVNAINANDALKFYARTSRGGKRVVISPRSSDAYRIAFNVPTTAALGLDQTYTAENVSLYTTLDGARSERTHYSLDRNTGQIRWNIPLASGDSLAAYSLTSDFAYRYSAGLIGEANRVLYGDPTDTATYPGVVAAGASVTIHAPRLRFVRVAMALRLRTGVSTTEVFEGVRSSIATSVNASKVGESVPLSRLVALASAVGGVLSVVVTEPVYVTGADTLVAESFEKLWVQDPQSSIGLIVM